MSLYAHSFFKYITISNLVNGVFAYFGGVNKIKAPHYKDAAL